MEKIGLSKQQIIAQLARSQHGELAAYLPIVKQAAQDEAEFLAHLIAWNDRAGQIRDTKIALPVGSLAVATFPFVENSLAHIALLDPRNLVRALGFCRDAGARRVTQLRSLVKRYLRAREESFGRWERTALQHRESLKTLYAKYHVKPAGFADAILFKGQRPAGSVFEAVANLKNMPAIEAAGTIVAKRIPFLVAVSSMGARMRETDVLMALIDAMSPAELVTNTRMLERYGVKEVPALRAAFEAGLAKVATSKKVTLKTQRAAEAMTDEKLKAKLVATQEKQIKALGGIEGNWLVLADRSPSMTTAIEASRVIAGTLAKFVKGEVWLIFFDSTPRAVNVTGKTYDEIKAETAMIRAGGSGTSIGCGVQYALDAGYDVCGIAIVTDGGENSAPQFAPTYARLCKVLDREIPVYLYLLKGQSNDVLVAQMQYAGLDMQTFDLRGAEVDYYSLPNLVQTMRASRYSLIDEIYATPLLALSDVFKTTEVANEVAA